MKTYLDVGVSGATSVLERPAFRELIDDVKNGRIQPRPMALITFEISRLVRNFQELFRLVDLVENQLGLFIISASERESMLQNLDPLTRQFLRAVLAFIATMERELIRQRTKAAMERLRTQGKIRSIVDQIPKEKALEILELRKMGLGYREIARRTGLSVYAVRRILASLGYINDGVCPRCLHAMRLVDRSITMSEGRYAVREVWYCGNCGFELIRHL